MSTIHLRFAGIPKSLVIWCLLVWDPRYKKSLQIANNNIVQDISAVYLHFVYQRNNWANSCDWSPVLTGVIQRRSVIYISVRSHGLYNALFSAFYSKQISVKIYFYLNVFGSKDSNLSFHENSLPSLQHAVALVRCFSCIDKQFTSENFSVKKKKINNKQFKFVFVRALFPARLIPSILPVWSSLYSSQPIRKIELIQSYCYLFPRELDFAKMEQVFISRFTQTCLLIWTKFREHCQNTDLYQQTVSFRIGHPLRPRSFESISRRAPCSPVLTWNRPTAPGSPRMRELRIGTTAFNFS